MNLSVYQNLAMRTLHDLGAEKNMLHAILGMAGEVGELYELATTEHYAGELGDCFWYASLLAKELGQSMEDLLVQIPEKPKSMIVISSGAMIELIKKTIFYGKEIDTNLLREYLGIYLGCLYGLAIEARVPVAEILSSNIKKLEARYPNLSFDADHAVNRNYTVESERAGVKVF